MPISSALGKAGVAGIGTTVECFVFSFFLGLTTAVCDTKPRSHSCMVAGALIGKKKDQLNFSEHSKLVHSKFAAKYNATRMNCCNTRQDVIQYNKECHATKRHL